MNDTELVCVLATYEVGRYLLAKSLLDRDSVDYAIRGDELRIAEEWRPTVLTEGSRQPVELWVRREDADRARTALIELDLAPLPDTENQA